MLANDNPDWTEPDASIARALRPAATGERREPNHRPHSEWEGRMARFTGATLLVVLLLTAPAFAQMTDSPSTPGNMPESGYHQKEMLATGRITEIDLSKGTVTLDTGTQFTLAPSLQYTSFPALGQEVQVTYSEDGGQKVARIIDVGGTHSQDSSN
jgi:hypothetical protein